MASLFEIAEVTFLWLDGPENTKQKEQKNLRVCVCICVCVCILYGVTLTYHRYIKFLKYFIIEGL